MACVKHSTGHCVTARSTDHIEMNRYHLVITLTLTTVIWNLTLILAVSSSIDQLKTEMDEIEKRMCAEPLPDDKQLEQMEECSPIAKIVVSIDAVFFCASPAS